MRRFLAGLASQSVLLEIWMAMAMMVCVWVCGHTYMGVRMCACVCGRVGIRTYMGVRMCACVCGRVGIRIWVYVCMCACVLEVGVNVRTY